MKIEFDVANLAKILGETPEKLTEKSEKFLGGKVTAQVDDNGIGSLSIVEMYAVGIMKAAVDCISNVGTDKLDAKLDELGLGAPSDDDVDAINELIHSITMSF